MSKQKINTETLVNACSNNTCRYNTKSFCQLPSIMLDEEGSCVYNNKREENKDVTS